MSNAEESLLPFLFCAAERRRRRRQDRQATPVYPDFSLFTTLAKIFEKFDQQGGPSHESTSSRNYSLILFSCCFCFAPIRCNHLRRGMSCAMVA